MNLSDLSAIYDPKQVVDLTAERHSRPLTVFFEALVQKVAGSTIFLGNELPKVLACINASDRIGVARLLSVSPYNNASVDTYGMVYDGKLVALLCQEVMPGDSSTKLTIVDEAGSIKVARFVINAMLDQYEAQAAPTVAQVEDSAVFGDNPMALMSLERGFFMTSTCDVQRLKDLSRRYQTFVLDDERKFRAVLELRSVPIRPQEIRIITVTGEFKTTVAEVQSYLVFSPRKNAQSSDLTELQNRVGAGAFWTVEPDVDHEHSKLSYVVVTQYWYGKIRPLQSLVTFASHEKAQAFLAKFTGTNNGVLEDGAPGEQFDDFRDNINWIMSDLPSRQRSPGSDVAG